MEVDSDEEEILDMESVVDEDEFNQLDDINDTITIDIDREFVSEDAEKDRRKVKPEGVQVQQ